MSKPASPAKRIPQAIRDQATETIERFNQDGEETIRYIARFKGLYLYLDRRDWGIQRPTHICRLEWTGDIKAWKFAIYLYSANGYDPDEFMFPGSRCIDGTIEGAMYAGLEAYEP